MNYKQILVLFTTVITNAHAQIASLKELAAQKYSKNLSCIVQDLHERKLNFDMQKSIKQQLIHSYLNRFPLVSKILTFSFGISSVSYSSKGKALLIVPNNHAYITSNYNSSMVVLVHLDNFTIKSTILRHNRLINKATFSSDGKYILTSANGHAYVRTITNPKTITMFSNDNMLSADFSPDGKLLIIYYDTVVFLYTMANFQIPPLILDHTNLLAHFPHEHHTITVAACSPDGKHILTGSSKGLLYLWDSTHPQEPPTILGDDGYYTSLAVHLLGHHDAITSLAFSACSRYVLTGSLDKTARLWDSARPQATPRIFHCDSPVHTVALSQCGKYALTTGLYSEKAYLWNVLDPTVLPLILKSDHATIFTAMFSHCGKYAITGEYIGQHQSVLRFWDLTTWHSRSLEDVIKKIFAH